MLPSGGAQVQEFRVSLALRLRDPRGVLKEFGVEISEKVEVRVWDSSAESATS